MAKKRQADFAKVQLKPGRSVGRKRNITETSFKAKKIVIQPYKKLKGEDDSKKTIVDHLKSMKATPKNKEFIDLRKLIIRDANEGILQSNLLPIFNYIFKIILEGHLDDNTRNAAVEVIISVLEQPNVQIHGFVPYFINFLSCAMTHTNIRIKEQSLKVLHSLLLNHPKLICNSMDILAKLLQMLTGPPRKWTHSQLSTKSHGRSSLEVMYSDNVYSPDWRIHVLGHINLFLAEMLKKKPLVEEYMRDEQEVYWDGKAPLHLQIYAGGGLKPVDIENCPLDDNEFYVDESVEEFIESITLVIYDVFTEEMASESKYDDNLHSKCSIINLSILFEVLSKVSEWMHLITSRTLGSKIIMQEEAMKNFLQESIWNKGRFPFFQRGTTVQESPGVRLNVAIAYLSSIWLLNKGDDMSPYEIIVAYIMKVFKMHYAIKCESIPMIVKIMKIYFDKRKIPGVLEYYKSFVTHLSSLLKVNHSHNEQLLLPLFINMSLDSIYHFLFTDSDCMKHWFTFLFNQLMEMPKLIKDKKNIDRKLLNAVKKIANRKYPYFLDQLQKSDAKIIKALINCDDEDVQDTAIFLIYHMRDIPASLFQNLYHLISLSKFSTKHAVQLIQLLTCRYSEKRSIGKPDDFLYRGKALLEVIMFVLNVAIDYSSIVSEKWTNFEENKCTKAMEIFKDTIAYIILPSHHWEEHSVLFNECLHFLNQQPSSIVNPVVSDLIKEILKNNTVLPMHSAIAILRIFKHLDTKRFCLSNLKFSALLTISSLTHMLSNEEWCISYKLVEQLLDSIDIDEECLNAFETLSSGIQNLQSVDEIEDIVGYHILRVIKFYLEKELLDSKNYKAVLQVMEILKDKTPGGILGHQPLYITLCRHLCGKYYS